MTMKQKRINFRTIMYLLVLVTCIIPIIRPIGLPVPIDPLTKEAFALVDSLKPGDYAVISLSFVAAQWSDVGPGVVAMINHLFRKDAKVIVVDFYRGDGALVMEGSGGWDSVGIPPGKVYGVDYVNLGFIPGLETAFKSFAATFPKLQGIASVDVRGRPISEMKIMQGIESFYDVALGMDVSEQVAIGVGQWKIPYKIKYIGFPNTMGVPTYMAYYTAKNMDAMMQGLAAGSQYEILIGKPGLGVLTQDAQSLAHLLILGVIVLGNIELIISRKKSGKG